MTPAAMNNDVYAEVVRFHGRECPGAAFGTRVAEAAVERFGRHSAGNELVAVTESTSCANDAIQVVTGCTFGTRALRLRDEGKKAFSFWRRADGAGIRITAVPNSLAFRTPDALALGHKIERGVATLAERETFAALQNARAVKLLAIPHDDIMVVGDAMAMPGRWAPHASSICEHCFEPTELDRLHNHGGSILCPRCHGVAHGGTTPTCHDGSTGHPH